MTTEATATPYAALGGETGIRRLVQRFYALMDELPEAYTVRQMHPESLQGSAQGRGARERAGAVYIADISAMPGMVTRLFALLKLRELPFQVGLAREAAAVADLPRRPGAATVLTLKGGQGTQVRYAQTEAALRQALGLAP